MSLYGLVVDEYGTERWYHNNFQHREDGPAVKYTDGTTYWYIHGSLHREDGPAVEYKNGSKVWYQNNQLHRVDGPAIEYIDGFKRWFINGIQLDCSTQEQFEKLMKLKAFW